MPRPKKIVTAVVEETLLDFIDVEEYVVEPVSIPVPELDTLEVEEFVSPVAVEKPVVQMTEPEPDPVAI
jgi:hypothetical protein